MCNGCNGSISKQFFTLSEIEEMGLMSHTSAWRQVQAGELEAIQIGTALRVPKEALEEFIEGHRFKVIA